MLNKTKMGFVVAIDGPAGAGKSTVSRRLAEKLGYTFLDSGALYRSVAYFATKQSLSDADEAGITEIAEKLDIRFENNAGLIRILANGQDVTSAIRKLEISQVASRISAHPEVRRALLDAQRRVALFDSVVAEGRDIGTIVFPYAQAKFFLTATQETRAQRRMLEMKQSSESVCYEDVLQQIIERDERDSGRRTAPLRQAEDAVLVDSTRLSVDEIIDSMASIVRNRGG